LDGNDLDVSTVGLDVHSECPSPGHSEFNRRPDLSMDSDINLEHPLFSQGYLSPVRSSFNRGLEDDEDLPALLGLVGSDAAEPHVPNSPYVPRVHHAKLDGTLQHLLYHCIDTNYKL
jgi:hypothetical protein